MFERRPLLVMALGRVLRMRGLPFSATDADVVEFFKAWDVEAVRLCFRQGASNPAHTR